MDWCCSIELRQDKNTKQVVRKSMTLSKLTFYFLEFFSSFTISFGLPPQTWENYHNIHPWSKLRLSWTKKHSYNHAKNVICGPTTPIKLPSLLQFFFFFLGESLQFVITYKIDIVPKLKLKQFNMIRD